MNKDLQYILDFIKNAEHLTEKEKADLTKSVKNADKELSISEFKLERTEKVKKTTAILLEETIQELEQKRKAVESHNRELEIESALERVRTRAMAMHDSNDVGNATAVMFSELEKLGVETLRCGILIIDESKVFEVWAAASSGEGKVMQIAGKLDSNIHALLRGVYTAWKAGESQFSYQLKGIDLEDYYSAISASPDYDLPAKKSKLQNQFCNVFFFKEGGLFTYTLESFPAEPIQILKKFAAVFGLTYRRYLDLKKAESQAREAQIEAALERVRSRTMEMHKSDELKDVVRVLYKEFRILVTDSHSVNIQLKLDSSKDIYYWASVEEDIYQELYHLPDTGLPLLEKIHNAFNSTGDGFVDYLLNKEEKDAFFSGIFKIQPVPPHRKKMIQNAEGMVMMGWFHKHSGIDIMRYNLKRFSEEEKEIVKRFAAAFEQTYIRFLDLQKAEAQARESKIQLALERVRARTMAMHKSDELADTAAILFQQMTELGVTPERLNICLIKETDNILEVWATDQQGIKISHHFNASLDEPTTGKRVYDAWKEKKKSIIIDLSGKELNDWIRYVREVMGMTIKAELVREHRIHSVAFFSQGMILTTTPEPLPEESIKLLERFADVFNLTYRRFLDLQKAEAQAREAKIEAALERVRARAMAMHSSDDLGETVDAFFSELTHLNVMPHRCGVGIINSETRTADINATTATHENERKKITGKLKLAGHPVLDKVFENWKSQEEYHPVLRGKEIINYYKVMNPQVEFPDFAGDEIQYGYYFYFKEGVVFGWTEKKLSETDLNIFRRFTSVLSLTYRRYLDLREAEAQAKEAIKQASLDRIRGEIASMRTSEDLNRITPVIWRELKALEVPFIRCGVFIVDEANKNVQVYLTTPEGKALGALHLAFDSNKLTSNTVKNWREKQVYKEHWNKEEFISWTKSMMKLGQVQNPETYQGASQPPDSLHLHFVPFTQGMLYVGNVSPLEEEKLELVKTLAEAFSIAYARYEDFKNLEEAKGKIEVTLSELKSAQAQLVHSEKMASLGELTAGIAHEIKNPLNFVNNFSEVSSELIDEMIEELQKGNNEDALDIVKDLKQNLEKINHHGKRADSIVKGMLLHSRGTAGEKTPTDINDLLEQYLNLAYHGMRAQNKDFNITIERDYDKSLQKIKVVPQDISRVFLNIINNGCYAANDKKKTMGDDFSPTIKVSTKNLKDKVEIRIADNGNGVPEGIKEKLFQPFFTTKPTGEGTGLGLSLSYDIVVKQHGGEIKIESKEGEGAEFIIHLPN